MDVVYIGECRTHVFTEILRLTDRDLVFSHIGTTHTQHYEPAKAALLAGKVHSFGESEKRLLSIN